MFTVISRIHLTRINTINYPIALSNSKYGVIDRNRKSDRGLLTNSIEIILFSTINDIESY